MKAALMNAPVSRLLGIGAVLCSASALSGHVADATEPSLVVTRLSDRTSGMIGLWVGNTSGGGFANLRISP